MVGGAEEKLWKLYGITRLWFLPYKVDTQKQAAERLKSIAAGRFEAKGQLNYALK